MIRILPSFAAVLAACSLYPEEAAMPGPSQNPQIAGNSGERKDGAALGPIAQPISAAENPMPAPPADSRAEAQGRRTLSTAFVRIGPDGLLTVQLQNGRTLVLRNLVMRRKNYCGMQLRGDQPGAEYCGGYAEVAAARPGGTPALAPPDLAAPNPIDSPGNPERRN